MQVRMFVSLIAEKDPLTSSMQAETNLSHSLILSWIHEDVSIEKYESMAYINLINNLLR